MACTSIAEFVLDVKDILVDKVTADMKIEIKLYTCDSA